MCSDIEDSAVVDGMGSRKGEATRLADFGRGGNDGCERGGRTNSVVSSSVVASTKPVDPRRSPYGRWSFWMGEEVKEG